MKTMAQVVLYRQINEKIKSIVQALELKYGLYINSYGV